jgi:hypothetical protein
MLVSKVYKLHRDHRLGKQKRLKKRAREILLRDGVDSQILQSTKTKHSKSSLRTISGGLPETNRRTH